MTAAERVAAVPSLPPPIGINELPAHVIVIVPEMSDAYERRPPTAIKVFAVRHTSTTCRFGVRQGDKRAEVVLNAAQLRKLADRLADAADLIDPDGADDA